MRSTQVMNNTENSHQEVDFKTNEPKNKEKEQKETEQHEKEWITVNAKVERKQQNNDDNNDKESYQNPHGILQCEEENNESNN